MEHIKLPPTRPGYKWIRIGSPLDDIAPDGTPNTSCQIHLENEFEKGRVVEIDIPCEIPGVIRRITLVEVQDKNYHRE